MLIDLRRSVLRGSDFANKTFFGVGSLEIQGSNPEESLDSTYQAKTYLT